MNKQYRDIVTNLVQNSENIASKRVEYLLDIIDFNQIKTILDIGSWHLKQTLELSQIFEFATIHAFEPNPETFQYCQNVLKSLPNFVKNRISIHDLALTNEIGKLSFYPLDKTKTHSSNEGIASLSKLRSDMDGSLLNDKWVQKEIIVNASTLDKWAEENGVHNIDLIWMDVQGAELKVLQGSKTVLPNVKAICTEAGLTPYYEEHSLKQHIDDFMKENNFIELENAFCKTTWSSDKAAEADVIYVNKKFIKV
jgi:FkbM family methyltransferase